MDDDDEVDDGFGRRVGERLRAIRRQKGLSLQEVEANSELEFKASVLGAYERGERAISVPRLRRLAAFYSVPVEQLLPQENHDGNVVDISEQAAVAAPSRAVTIDLLRLGELDAPGAELLVRYFQMIQVQRQDFNGRVLTVRRDDMRVIACILDTSVEDAAVRLQSLGLCLTS